MGKWHGDQRNPALHLKIADDLCLIRSLHSEAINHDPAITFFQTGSQIAGRPSMGSWLSYGLGSENANLPAFCVLITKDKGGQPLYSRLLGQWVLPSVHQGVPFRAGSDPVLYLDNPQGISQSQRRRVLDTLKEWNPEWRMSREHDPEIATRIAQYEMAFRMQSSVPEVMDLSGESEATFKLYGDDAKKPGTFASNCLLARRLAERGVRFIQLFHQGWDQHGGLPEAFEINARKPTRHRRLPWSPISSNVGSSKIPWWSGNWRIRPHQLFSRAS